VLNFIEISASVLEIFIVLQTVVVNLSFQRDLGKDNSLTSSVMSARAKTNEVLQKNNARFINRILVVKGAKTDCEISKI